MHGLLTDRVAPLHPAAGVPKELECGAQEQCGSFGRPMRAGSARAQCFRNLLPRLVRATEKLAAVRILPHPIRDRKPVRGGGQPGLEEANCPLDLRFDEASMPPELDTRQQTPPGVSLHGRYTHLQRLGYLASRHQLVEQARGRVGRRLSGRHLYRPWFAGD